MITSCVDTLFYFSISLPICYIFYNMDSDISLSKRIFHLRNQNTVFVFFFHIYNILSLISSFIDIYKAHFVSDSSYFGADYYILYVVTTFAPLHTNPRQKSMTQCHALKFFVNSTPLHRTLPL